jgi:hypothetical protein
LPENSFRPPAPMPQAEPLGPLSFLRTLWNNPIEAWTRGYFERTIVKVRLPFGEVAVVHDPVAWTLFLLSQSSAWRERVIAEARRAFDGRPRNAS